MLILAETFSQNEDLGRDPECLRGRALISTFCRPAGTAYGYGPRGCSSLFFNQINVPEVKILILAETFSPNQCPRCENVDFS